MTIVAAHDMSMGEFNVYLGALVISGVILIGMAVSGFLTDTSGERVLWGILGLAFLGYAFYLEFIFDGVGTVFESYYVFAVPVLVIVRGFQARKAKAATPPPANPPVPNPYAQAQAYPVPGQPVPGQAYPVPGQPVPGYSAQPGQAYPVPGQAYPVPGQPVPGYPAQPGQAYQVPGQPGPQYQQMPPQVAQPFTPPQQP